MGHLQMTPGRDRGEGERGEGEGGGREREGDGVEDGEEKEVFLLKCPHFRGMYICTLLWR